jgi:hypothetical protein
MTRRLMFALGVSLLPWLGGCLVTVAWAGSQSGLDARGTLRDLMGNGFVLLPALVFLVVLGGTYLVESQRFEGWFGSQLAVGFGVMVLSGIIPMVLGTVVDGEWGFGFASMFVMFSGYPLFAFAAGALLHWKDTPAADDVIPQLTNRP